MALVDELFDEKLRRNCWYCIILGVSANIDGLGSFLTKKTDIEVTWDSGLARQAQKSNQARFLGLLNQFFASDYSMCSVNCFCGALESIKCIKPLRSLFNSLFTLQIDSPVLRLTPDPQKNSKIQPTHNNPKSHVQISQWLSLGIVSSWIDPLCW